ncbi:MAG: hypothetical protein RTU30_10730 [Candidatus Thorarchaeota archaeon]
MKVSTTKTMTMVFLCFTPLLLIFLPVQISSPPPFESILTDDFDDYTLDDWIITRGVFSAERQTLWAHGDEAQYTNRAYHECQLGRRM